jgi:predicted ribonuclease YlaK
MSFKALFIDTNILLHYQSFDEIDWLRILNVEQVEIRLPSIVIQELDKHKYSSSSKLRDKATKVIRKLHKLADSGLKIQLKTNVYISFEVNIKLADLTAMNLDPNSQDDRLLSSILSFRAENPDLQVILAAADLGLRLKAKYYQIEAICLADDLKLPSELDQSEKRIKELEQEVLELKRRTPELKLYFSGRSDRLNYQIKKLFPADIDLNSIAMDIQLVYPLHNLL